jgi:hypothetical protein
VRIAVIPAVVFLISVLKTCTPGQKPSTAPSSPVHDIVYNTLDSRQQGLFLTYPSVTSTNAGAYWMDPLNLSQRVEFAGGFQALELAVEKATNLHAVTAVTSIRGSEPGAASEDQFHNEVIWDKDAAARIKNLPHWSEHIALLHPGQYGYQENRDGNPFRGLVVLFDENAANPTQPAGQFHIDFRSFFSHYEPENGDIGNPDNYKLFTAWYGSIDDFAPLP